MRKVDGCFATVYGTGVDRMDIPNHLDISNPYSFEMKDLEKLIKKVSSAE